MDFQLPPNQQPTQVGRSANAHKMDLQFLCSGLTALEIRKPTNLTHNKVEKAHPTANISHTVLHTKTQLSGVPVASIQKPTNKHGKVGWNKSCSQPWKKFKAKNKNSSAPRNRKRKINRARIRQAESYKKKGVNERDPTKVSEIYTEDVKKRYPYICGVCKRMYRFEVNLLNHDIVDHHFDRGYLYLPKSRGSHDSSRRTTELELISCALFGGDAAGMGNPDQWLDGDLTILNVQWARYLFDDERTIKICMDSGMSFAEVTDIMKRLDELDRLDKEEFDAAKVEEEKESYMRNMKETLSKRDFAFWKAAFVENELAEGVQKMMKGP